MTEIKVVVVNDRKKAIEVKDGYVLVFCGHGPNDGAFWKKFEECGNVDFAAADEVPQDTENKNDNEPVNVTETDEDVDNEKYRNGINYLVNMIIENPGNFINLSAACIDTMYPNFMNPAIAGLNARDCEKMAVLELASFAGETVCNTIIDVFFASESDNVKNEILSFLVNAKLSMNEINFDYIVKMVEIYISRIATANAQ